MHKLRNSLAGGLLLALVFVVAARAQQRPPQQAPAQQQDQSTAPIPAYHSPLASQSDNNPDQNADNSQGLVPDDRALSGAQNLSLGSPETSRSYWQPHVDVIATADTNAFGGNPGWTTYSTITGGIDLHKISGHSDATLSYVAGGIVSNDGGVDNTLIQQLNFAEKVSVRRMVLSFLDYMDYLPQASLGYAGGGGLGLPGGGSLGLQPGFIPTDSVLTTRAQRIDNSFLTEADVKLTPQSSVTVLGGYSLSHYFDNSQNLLNFNTSTAQAGFNRKIGRRNTLAAFYRFSAIRYNSVNQSINDNVVHLSYGRSVTGRLAFQFDAGPEYTTFAIPVSTSSTGIVTSSSQLNWSASGSLTYQLRRANLAATYFHGVGTGSGVLAGSLNDTLTGSLSRQLSRTFSGAITGGYARNEALAIPGYGIYNQSYNYVFAGASLSHPLGRTMSLFFSYQAQDQFSNVTFCAGVTCSANVLAHLISVGLHWQARPMLF